MRASVVIPGPGRLVVLSGLVVLTVATLVGLVELTKGGFDRHGLRQLAGDTAAALPPPKPVGYLKR